MNAINWFEIPVVDMDRAVRFYEALLGQSLNRQVFMDVPHALFASSKDGGVGGALINQANRKPSVDGTTVYLHSPDIDAALQRVAKLGVEIMLPKMGIGDMGSIALLRDCEGNMLGLHTPPG